MKLPKLQDLSPVQKKIYISFRSAKQRCTNPKDKDYKWYGAKGIQYKIENKKCRRRLVLEQEASYRKAMRKYPNDRITINRINSNGHYEDGNIEWISIRENTRKMQEDNVNNPTMKAANKKNGELSAKRFSKKVRCLTTGEIYPSMMEAERKTGVSNSGISMCCSGTLQSAGKTKDGRKRVWRYAQ